MINETIASNIRTLIHNHNNIIIVIISTNHLSLSISLPVTCLLLKTPCPISITCIFRHYFPFLGIHDSIRKKLNCPLCLLAFKSFNARGWAVMHLIYSSHFLSFPQTIGPPSARLFTSLPPSKPCVTRGTPTVYSSIQRKSFGKQLLRYVGKFS